MHFTDIFDFCERVDLRRVNKRVVESLMKCGAFDSTGAKRAPLMAVLEEADHAGAEGPAGAGERPGFPFRHCGNCRKETATARKKLPDVPEWDEKLLLGFEKEALGFFITGHPLTRYVPDMKRFAAVPCAQLPDMPDKSEVRICGIVAALKENITKKGDRMGFATIEDLTGSVEVVIFPETYATGCRTPEEGCAAHGKRHHRHRREEHQDQGDRNRFPAGVDREGNQEGVFQSSPLRDWSGTSWCR